MEQTYEVAIIDTNQRFPCKETESLLSGMERAKVKPFPVGCRGGGCGICKIQVVEGEVELGAMSRAHISQEDEKNGMVLACRAKPKGNVKLHILS